MSARWRVLHINFFEECLHPRIRMSTSRAVWNALLESMFFFALSFRRRSLVCTYVRSVSIERSSGMALGPFDKPRTPSVKLSAFSYHRDRDDAKAAAKSLASDAAPVSEHCEKSSLLAGDEEMAMVEVTPRSVAVPGNVPRSRRQSAVQMLQAT